MRLAYETNDGLYQHQHTLFNAGTKDFPVDCIDDLRSPFGDILDKSKRGREAEAYYRSHREIDTVIGHSRCASVSLALGKQHKKEGNNPYGIIQSKAFGAPVISCDFPGTTSNRVGWDGDPTSALYFSSATLIPSFKQRWNNSAHLYSAFFVKDAAPVHDAEHNTLTPSPNEIDAQAITH